ncbi:MAG TPA: Gfo/Idh/MocA family oxidoreductase [Actinospica sp.]|nr:Gfo/Idh/MocA family oxidoreductase [Actinospica sp.]
MADRIRWGIAGTGGIASRFAEDLRLLPDAEVVAVGSRTQAAADAFADRFGAPHRHVGYEALAADPEVDAIYVAGPHSTHCEAALAAIAGGKAVLVEKAFSVTGAEAERMIDAARAAGTFLMEAMWVRWLPHFQLVRTLLAEGRIGRVRQVISDRGETLSTDPLHRINNPLLAGGALLDLGIYPGSFASMVVGGKAPTQVEAAARMTETGVDAQTSMILTYDDGAQSVISTSLDARSANTAVITGTEGRIVLSQPWARVCPVELIRNDGTVETTQLPHEGIGLRHQAAEVGLRLRAGELESPVMPLDETLTIMRTFDRVRERIGLTYPGE